MDMTLKVLVKLSNLGAVELEQIFVESGVEPDLREHLMKKYERMQGDNLRFLMHLDHSLAEAVVHSLKMAVLKMASVESSHPNGRYRTR